LRHRGLADADLALAIERQAGSMLGAMRIEGPRGLFPMVSMTAQRLVGPRLALIGEAAHVLPPIGAQGLNLGLRDVAHLFDQILAARARREDLGGPEVLAAYEARRRGDVLSRGLAIDVLNRSLLSDLLPADFLRGAGLLALASIGPLRRALMRRGVAEAGDRPNWLRPYALDAGGAALR
jgi:2-octaprenyl-6-methoxyphenol hydroxylase